MNTETSNLITQSKEFQEKIQSITLIHQEKIDELQNALEQHSDKKLTNTNKKDSEFEKQLHEKNTIIQTLKSEVETSKSKIQEIKSNLTNTMDTIQTYVQENTNLNELNQILQAQVDVFQESNKEKTLEFSNEPGSLNSLSFSNINEKLDEFKKMTKKSND